MAEEKEVSAEEKGVPAEAKPVGRRRASSEKKNAPNQVRRIWRADNAVGDAVGAVVTDMVTAIEVATSPAHVLGTGVAPVPSVEKTTSGRKRMLSKTATTRKRRRRILGEDNNDENEDSPSEEGNARVSAPAIPTCVINDDPNLMRSGAVACTGLNSDEDPDICEDQEEEVDEDDDGAWDGDWDIGELTDGDSDAEPEELPASIWSSLAKDGDAVKAMRTSGWEYDPAKFGPNPKYTDLYDGPYGPSTSILAVAEDPLALLFYFLPPKLWSQIAVESNRYHAQTIPLRARALRAQQRRSGGEVEDLADIQRRLANVPDIEAWEVLRAMALLIARMLTPIGKGIAAHWSLKRVGALPANRFGQFMSKHRFFHIMGYLHFSNNKSSQANLDRAWKIRPIVEVLQRTFARGYKAPPVISFDEATLPSRSRYNPTRIEVYCGAKTHLRTPLPKDNNTGEAAVLRNMSALCPPSKTSPWRLVITDRFYTSVKLALELLHRRMYLTGTIQTDRSGYAKDVVTKMKTRTVNKKKVVIPSQGTTKLAENKMFPQLTAVMWMDRHPVHMLSSGGSRETGIVMRRIHGEMKPIPAPELVRDYHRWMGGVDVHDQLRMQRYSVQLSYKTRKYYRTLFFGLFDMAVVNAFIVFRHFRKVNDKHPPRHFAFMETLMEQLLAIDSTEAFAVIEQATTARERTAASPVRADNAQQRPVNERTAQVDEGYRLEENPDVVDGEQGVKRRQRSCKVKYLCNVGRDGRDTCFRIWHIEWKNGSEIPPSLIEGH
ncbi:Hypothetical protein PHPALM_9902 [Phytophthora palmivora]|uniref:PiggyBac transposable element-derived protein domain-containing protein n=1 Tax=Phytophthora palmivora TaxID=4796 RepID=A0A2P4Y629_9STRA|nr:Hypothetical protein PHPALM_9902 [Phytophthora palmivora]